uniref:ParB/Sulfiredoxin domain-containing protein n=1 Tax=Pseudomonas phage RVTF4 TaxID=3236931 RepID=A0AB39CDB4_9VIRU
MGTTYGVDDLLVLTRNTPVVELQLSLLTWMIDDDYNLLRAKNADTSVPIIVTQLQSGEWVTLDGYHRVIKAAWMEKRKTIKAKIVTPQMLQQLRTL